MSDFPSSGNAFPPTGPTAPLPRDPSDSTWPGWLGGFSIGIGALMLIGALCGSAAIWGTGWAMRSAGMDVPSPPGAMIVFLVVDALVGVVLAVLLVLGGLGTLQRKQSGPRRLRTYAIIRVALALPLLACGMWMLPANAEWTARIAQATIEFKERQKPPIAVTQAERDAAHAPEPNGFQKFSMVFGTVSGLIFPVIVLSVLARAGTKQDIESFNP